MDNRVRYRTTPGGISMGDELAITKVEVLTYSFESKDLAMDEYYNGFNLVYKPGAILNRTSYVLRIHTDRGIVGEFASGKRSYRERIRWAGYGSHA
jgi:hypothetical protein